MDFDVDITMERYWKIMFILGIKTVLSWTEFWIESNVPIDKVAPIAPYLFA